MKLGEKRALTHTKKVIDKYEKMGGEKNNPIFAVSQSYKKIFKVLKILLETKFQNKKKIVPDEGNRLDHLYNKILIIILRSHQPHYQERIRKSE